MSSLTEIDRYLRRTGMAATTFGRCVARDPRLVADMRAGRRIGPRMRGRVAAFIGASA